MDRRKVVILIYLLLTIVKFFTAEIYMQREEDPTIYFKLYPSVSNVFYGSDMHLEEYADKYEWFDKGEFWEICHGNGEYYISLAYRIVVSLWWFFTVLSTVLLIFDRKRNRQKTVKNKKNETV